MNLREIRWGRVVDWIDLAQDRAGCEDGIRFPGSIITRVIS